MGGLAGPMGPGPRNRPCRAYVRRAPDAVQAKNYGRDHTVTKRDIDTFLSESNRAAIGSRLLIASTDKIAAFGARSDGASRKSL